MGAFLKERTSASTLLSKELPDFKKFKTLLESCIQKASADALRYSQLLEKMNKDKIQLEEKLLFVRYLMLQPDAVFSPNQYLRRCKHN
ncbi:hypothetical protein [Niabella hibiscisoli]|uniref:hypothetical protein n=1 Tax=Niabella hibiscisoli TaxID=1825928 RepID=UPI001F0EB700|nr:hypothetical protein [Niabella hibiscisoli]MCH5721115.1 hypothetical protein [Niabella hibiscisoli]